MCRSPGKLLNVIVVHLWEIESKGSGVLSLVFAPMGAGYALYSARKPKFQAVFQPLGAPHAYLRTAGIESAFPALPSTFVLYQIKQQNFGFVDTGELHRCFGGDGG